MVNQTKDSKNREEEIAWPDITISQAKDSES